MPKRKLPEPKRKVLVWFGKHNDNDGSSNMGSEAASLKQVTDCQILYQASLADLQNALLSCQSQVLHISGLSQDYSHEDLYCIIKTAGLDETGSLECVVLNICGSNHLATRLTAAGCQASIGWDGDTTDQACTSFSEHFYDGLSLGRSYRHCFELGQNAVHVINKNSAFRVSPDNKARRTSNAIDPQRGEVSGRVKMFPVLEPAADAEGSLICVHTAEVKKRAHNVTITFRGDGAVPSAVTTFIEESHEHCAQPELLGIPAPGAVDFTIRWKGKLSDIKDTHEFLDEFEHMLHKKGVNVTIQGLERRKTAIRPTT